MLKSFYKKLIIAAFGQYVENFDDKIIEVSSWEGSFKAENLIVKKDALNFLSSSTGIPFKVEYGVIKKIELQVEWDQILSSPSYLYLSDIHLLATTSHEYSQDFHNQIKSKIKNQEIEKKFKKMCENIFHEKYSDSNFSANVTWKQKLLKSFTQNINMIIENIHIRFEENYDIKKFNFGVTINRLEWLNTNKNGEENFMDYETRKTVGKTFSMIKVYRLSSYFNSNATNYHSELNRNSQGSNSGNLIKNFSSILGSRDENNLELNSTYSNIEIGIIQNLSSSEIFKSQNSDYTSSGIKSSKSIQIGSVLPSIYQQYYEFSSKIFNLSSLEYSYQNFILEPLDIFIKFRKNLNPKVHLNLPLVTTSIETSHEILLKINNNMMLDLIYLFNLKKYHGHEQPSLGVKKDFMKEKYTKPQYLKLFVACVNSIQQSKKLTKTKFYETLQYIKNYKELYYKLLLNQHEYTSTKLPNSELFSCNIDGKLTIFSNLSQIQNLLLKIEYLLDEKLVYKLRLQTLVKFKNYLIKDSKKYESSSEKIGIFKFFDFFKKSGESQALPTPHEKTLEECLLENYDYIESIINRDIKDINLESSEASPTKVSKFKQKQLISMKSIKLHSCCILFQMNHNQKTNDLIKLNFSNLILQTYETNFYKRIFFTTDEITLYDESLPTTKFRYVFSKHKMINYDQRESISLKTCFDDISYDSDGFLEKINSKNYKSIENHFIKFLFQNDTSLMVRNKNKFFLDIKENDFFININFCENLSRFKLLAENEINFIEKRNNYDMGIENENLGSLQYFKKNYIVNNLFYFEIKISKMQFMMLFDIMKEDYRAWILSYESINLTSQNNMMARNLKIKNFRFIFSNNFISSTNNLDKSKEFEILSKFNMELDQEYSFTSSLKTQNIKIDRINLFISKNLFNSLLEYYHMIQIAKILEKFKRIENKINPKESNPSELKITPYKKYTYELSDSKSEQTNDIIMFPKTLEFSPYANEEFEEAVESLEIAESNDTNYQFKFPQIIDKIKTSFTIDSLVFMIEGFQDKERKLFSVILCGISLYSNDEYSNLINDKTLMIKYFQFETINLAEEKDMSNSIIKLRDYSEDNSNICNAKIQIIDSKNIIIDLNLISLTLYLDTMKSIIQNIVLIKNLPNLTNILKFERNKYDNITRVDSMEESLSESNENTYSFNINLSEFEFFYYGGENNLSTRKLRLDAMIKLEKNKKEFKICFYKFMLCDLSGSLEIFINKIPSAEEIKINPIDNSLLLINGREEKLDDCVNKILLINVGELNIIVRQSIIENLKIIKDLRNYLEEIGKNLFTEKRNNNKIMNNNHTSLECKINKTNIKIDLYESSEILMEIFSFSFHETIDRKKELNFDIFKIFLVKLKMRDYIKDNCETGQKTSNNSHIIDKHSSNINNFEFLYLNSLKFCQWEHQTEIYLEKELKIKILFYYIPVIRDLHKFYMHIDNILNFKSPSYNTNNIVQNKKHTIRVKYFEVILIDFFLKEKIEDITNNNNFFLKFCLENLTLDYISNLKLFELSFSFYIFSGTEKILKAYHNENKNSIDNFSIGEEYKNTEFNSSLIDDLDASQNFITERNSMKYSMKENIKISMNDEQMVIDFQYFKFVISENILSTIKILKKYSTLFKHYLVFKQSKPNLVNPENKLSPKNSNSNLKFTQIFVQILKLKSFKLNFENVYLKFKNFTENQNIKVYKNLILHFSFEFLYFQFNPTDNNLVLHDFSSKISNFEIFFNTIIKKGSQKEIHDTSHILYPMNIEIDAKNDVNISIDTIELDLSIKKIAMTKFFLSLFDDMSFNSFNKLQKSTKDTSSSNANNYVVNKLSKREIIKRAFFEYRQIITKVKCFTLIIAKEDIYNLKLYEPLLCLRMESIIIQNSGSEKIKFSSDINFEYFNNFNEYWEPMLEKTNMIINYSKENFLEFDFYSGLNFIYSLQLFKTLKVFLEDKNNLEKYKNEFMFNTIGGAELENIFVDDDKLNLINSKVNNTKNNNNNDRETNNQPAFLHNNMTTTFNNTFNNLLNMPGDNNNSFSQYSKLSFGQTKSNSNNLHNFNLDSKTKLSYKLINNNLNFESALMRNTYQFQIENNTGEVLLMIVDDKHVIKISHLQTIPIEKILLRENDFLNQSPSFINLKKTSLTSLNSFTTHDMKTQSGQKFKQQNEKLKELKFIKYIKFQIPFMKKNFCINLLKNNQEIEIFSDNEGSSKRTYKILINIYIDSNGRKVVSLKSPLLVRNNYSNMSLEMQMSNQEDFSQLFNLILPSNTDNYIPIRYQNYNYFKVRPFFPESNYYQPYNYSEHFMRDFNILKTGKILNSELKNQLKDSQELGLKILCSSDITKFDKYYLNEIIFDYTIEIFNYVPSLLNISFTCDREKDPYEEKLLKSLKLEPFTLNQINYLSPDELNYLNIISHIKNEVSMNSSSDSYVKLETINMNTLRINQSASFDYKFVYSNFTMTTVKIHYEMVNKKVILSFYVDYILLNELDENIFLKINEKIQRNLIDKNDKKDNNQDTNISIVNNPNKKQILISSNSNSHVKEISSLQESALMMGLNKNIKNAGTNKDNIINPLRKISIESDLISITKRSESKLFGENRKSLKSLKSSFDYDKLNNLEKSVNFFNFETPGYQKILNFCQYRLPKILTKELNILNQINLPSVSPGGQNFKAMNLNSNHETSNLSWKTVKNTPQQITHSKLLIPQNLSNLLYAQFYNRKDLQGYQLSSNVQFFSLEPDEEIKFKIDESEEIPANFIRDQESIYKNHYIKMTFKNKNMVEVLCNTNYMSEYFHANKHGSLLKKFKMTKVLFLKNKYILVNNSNLNLIITQENCFNEGFYVLHAHDKMNFRWINFEKPFLLKLKINESNFTNAFNIETVGEYYFQMKLNWSNIILKVSIVDTSGRIMVFIEESTNDPPFTIENNTNKIFRIQEKDKIKNNIISSPFTYLPFCFDDLTKNQIEILECPAGLESINETEKYTHLLSIDMNKIENEGNYEYVKYFKNLKIEITKNENMNSVLKFSEVENEEIMQFNSKKKFNDLLLDLFKFKKKSAKNKLEFKFKTKFLGFSLIDLSPKEISYIYIKNLEIDYLIYNKRFYEFFMQFDLIQVDNSLENSFYDVVFKTVNTHYLNRKALLIKSTFSYNNMGNIMFVNKLNLQINSQIYLKLDGLFLLEILNYYNNLKAIFKSNEKNDEDEDLLEEPAENVEIIKKENNTSETKIKYLFNNIFISSISIDFSFRPSMRLLKALPSKYTFLGYSSKVINLCLKIEKFESTGVKSFETIKTNLSNNLPHRYFFLQLIGSLDIFFNISNMFTNVKYGFDSIINSLKIKKNDSYLYLPQKFIFGFFDFFLYLYYGISSSIINFFSKLRNLFQDKTLHFRINKNFSEEDLNNKWYLYNNLLNNHFQNKFISNKRFYFVLNLSKKNDYNNLITMNFFAKNSKYGNRNKIKYYFTKLVNGSIQVISLPFKMVFSFLQTFVYLNEYLNKKLLTNNKLEKIRSTRYINKSSCKIEDYSETRALAYEKLIKNKKILNIMEEIENYYSLNEKDSIIITNIRIIFVRPCGTNSLSLSSIKLDNIFFYKFDEKNLTIKIIIYDEEVQRNLLKNLNFELKTAETDDLYENLGFVYKMKKRNHMCYKFFEIKIEDKNSLPILKSIHATLVERNRIKKI